ncbi:MAG: trigger factor [Lachnospiraceae bacterium]|nr:trigger factor [Lachnospiraceae bacterium]
MSVIVEKLEGALAKLTIEVSAEEFEGALNRAYLKNKNQIQLPGFRKGKAPRAMVEKMYGAGVFYEDAANDLIPTAYEAALEDEACKDLDIVAQPEIDVTQIEKGKPFIFTAEVTLKPEVELGEYKGIDVERKTAEVTDEEVDQEIDRVREQNSRTIDVDDRPVQDGDIAVIDYEGFCDGEAFEGGKAENHELTIGSHSFIDTFEDQIIGKNIGDEFDVNVTVPEEYHAENLKGKPAVFKVKVNGIKVKELPELDDEFASEVSDFETLDEYKADVRKGIADRKQGELDNARRDEILKKAVENAKFEVPDKMIEFQARQMVNDYAQRLEMQGLSMDMYMKYTGQTMSGMVDQMKDQAKMRIENSLVLEAIAKAEGIEVTDEDLNEQINKMAESYQIEPEKMQEYVTDAEKDNIRKDLAIQKALDLIAE